MFRNDGYDKIDEYSLDTLLNHAFSLFCYHFFDLYGKTDLRAKDVSRFYSVAQLGFSKIFTYSINAQKVLRESKSSKDVIDFRQFINIIDENTGEYTTNLTNEELREKYNARGYELLNLQPGCAFKISDSSSFNLIDINSLQPLEREAFYGGDAQKAMGWIPVVDSLDRQKIFQKINNVKN